VTPNAETVIIGAAVFAVAFVAGAAARSLTDAWRLWALRRRVAELERRLK
jgi:hypothetical protein